MLNLILGIIIGIILTTAVEIVSFFIILYFRKDIVNFIETKSEEFDKKTEDGFIIEPPTESDDIRNDIIKENKKKGKDTYLSDLL